MRVLSSTGSSGSGSSNINSYTIYTVQLHISAVVRCKIFLPRFSFMVCVKPKAHGTRGTQSELFSVECQGRICRSCSNLLLQSLCTEQAAHRKSYTPHYRLRTDWMQCIEYVCVSPTNGSTIKRLITAIQTCIHCIHSWLSIHTLQTLHT